MLSKLKQWWRDAPQRERFEELAVGTAIVTALIVLIWGVISITGAALKFTGLIWILWLWIALAISLTVHIIYREVKLTGSEDDDEHMDL